MFNSELQKSWFRSFQTPAHVNKPHNLSLDAATDFSGHASNLEFPSSLLVKCGEKLGKGGQEMCKCATARHAITYGRRPAQVGHAASLGVWIDCMQLKSFERPAMNLYDLQYVYTVCTCHNARAHACRDALVHDNKLIDHTRVRAGPAPFMSCQVLHVTYLAESFHSIMTGTP